MLGTSSLRNYDTVQQFDPMDIESQNDGIKNNKCSWLNKHISSLKKPCAFIGAAVTFGVGSYAIYKIASLIGDNSISSLTSKDSSVGIFHGSNINQTFNVTNLVDNTTQLGDYANSGGFAELPSFPYDRNDVPDWLDTINTSESPTTTTTTAEPTTTTTTAKPTTTTTTAEPTTTTTTAKPTTTTTTAEPTTTTTTAKPTTTTTTAKPTTTTTTAKPTTTTTTAKPTTITTEKPVTIIPFENLMAKVGKFIVCENNSWGSYFGAEWVNKEGEHQSQQEYCRNRQRAMIHVPEYSKNIKAWYQQGSRFSYYDIKSYDLDNEKSLGISMGFNRKNIFPIPVDINELKKTILDIKKILNSGYRDGWHEDMYWGMGYVQIMSEKLLNVGENDPYGIYSFATDFYRETRLWMIDAINHTSDPD